MLQEAFDQLTLEELGLCNGYSSGTQSRGLGLSVCSCVMSVVTVTQVCQLKQRLAYVCVLASAVVLYTACNTKGVGTGGTMSHGTPIANRWLATLVLGPSSI